MVEFAYTPVGRLTLETRLVVRFEWSWAFPTNMTFSLDFSAKYQDTRVTYEVIKIQDFVE